MQLLLAVAMLAGGVAVLGLGGCAAAVSSEREPGGPQTPERPGERDDHGDTRAGATAIAAGTHSGRLVGDDVDYFRVAVEASSVRVIAATEAGAAALAIEAADGSVIGSVGGGGRAAWGDLPAPRPEQVYIRVSRAGRSAGNERTDYELAVWVVAALDAQRGDPFEIELRYPGTQPTASQKAALEEAARFWEGVISAGLPDVPVPTSGWKCRAEDPSLFGEYLDDLTIYVRSEAIAGAPAESTICARRAAASGGLPFLGSVTFDPGELEAMEEHGYLQRVAMRQIAYVLGFGLLWDEEQFGLLRAPSVDAAGAPRAGQDTHFAGDQARAAFAAAGGGEHAGSAVPVENDSVSYGSGILDLHWRESVFGVELMSTVLDTVDPPVSRVTIASLADLGYAVDYALAESYTLPARPVATGEQTTAGGGLQFGGRAARHAAVAVAEPPGGRLSTRSGS